MVGQTQTDENMEDVTTDVQAYLITKYKDALRRGDKSYAKSCLLSTRLFSVNDPSITNEIYLMAKSDGDVSEAAKCFANIFNDLLLDDKSSKDEVCSETMTVINQMKEEIRLLLNELKLQFLRLKSNAIPSAQTTSGLQSRQASIVQSPMLSPRLRMSSEDRAASKDSVSKLNNHLHSTRKSFFYQQLFENLPKDVKKNILTYSIEICENPFERCRLMMLALNIFKELVVDLGPRLLKTLTELSQSVSEKNNTHDKLLNVSRPSALSHYAKSMLVLDAIPLVFNLEGSEKLDIQLDELLMQTLVFYSDHCLESVADEYELSELHEGLKKTIAARILGKEAGTPDDQNSDCLISSMDLLMEKFLHDMSYDNEQREKMRHIRQFVHERINKTPSSVGSIMDIIRSLELEKDIPEHILFPSMNQLMGQPGTISTTTTPLKGRGRPKKVQQPSVIVSLDDGARRHMRNKAMESNFVYFSLVQMLFQNSFQYLRQTKSRILIEFDNPMANLIESELSNGCKSSVQRVSKSKNSSLESSATPSKKIKIDQSPQDKAPARKLKTQFRIPTNSPLNSEASRKLDQEISDILKEIHECIQYLRCGSETMTKLWNSNFLPNMSHTAWFTRVFVDSLILAGQYDEAVKRLGTITQNFETEPQIKKDDAETSTLTITTCPSATNARQIRAATQTISCYIQLVDKTNLFKAIDDLLCKLRISGLLINDGGYSTGNIIEEYMMLVDRHQDASTTSSPKYLGFLFFDTLSLIRYVVDILMDILKRHTNRLNATSDIIVGHSIVLCQLDWPTEAALYEHCISWLRSSKPKSTTPQCLSELTKFTYPEFFQYVTDPNIIEDFVSLLSEGYTLDISASQGGFPSSSQRSGHSNTAPNMSSNSASPAVADRASTRASKTMTTRGVNRNFKDQLRYLLVDQMENSSTIVPLSLITGFIQTSLLPYFTCTLIKGS